MNKAKQLAKRLFEALESTGLKQSDLATKLGVSRALVSQWVSGEKEIPTERVEQISKAMNIDHQYLLGAYASSTSQGTPLAELSWQFREAPEDGGRDYGNSNLFATPPDIKTLIRETGQNSKDQKVQEKVHLRYHLIELNKGSADYTAFLKALRFPSFIEHLEAAGATKSRRSSQLRAAAKRFEGNDKLFLLRVDDFGCTGLYGEERTVAGEKENPFAALIRNNLDSAKRTKTAGGSFGLGKATLWRCSELSLVLFSSEIGVGSPIPDTDKLRFIAKAELTWHERQGKGFAGPGWFSAAKMESIRSSRDQLAPLFLDRQKLPAGFSNQSTSGTSALIVGFQDPESDVFNADKLLQMIETEAALNFWPAISKDELAVSVSYQVDSELRSDRLVDPKQTEAKPFVSALLAHKAGDVVDEPEATETARRSVELKIPGTLTTAREVAPDQPQIDAATTLLVRLADDNDAASKYVNHVALVRGRGMVVKYWPRRNILVGARPFHAVLLAGEASEQGSEQAEEFLRLSEPPAHNEWVGNEDIRDNYRRGGGQRLLDFFDRASAVLRELIRPDADGVQEQPEDLMRLLRIGGGTAAASSAAQLRGVKSSFSSGVWNVEGSIKVLDKKRGLDISILLGIQPESGSPLNIPWATIKLLGHRGGTALLRPDNSIEVPQGVTSFSFQAVSQGSPQALRLEKCRASVAFSVSSTEAK